MTSSINSVSIILAAYKSPWLGDAIRSVVEQSHNLWELLVVDDANEVRARETVLEFEDARIRYLPNPRPLGPALNHQRGIDEARHDLVAFINHDDVWERDLLSKLLPALEDHPSAVVSFSDHWVIREDGTVDMEASNSYSRGFHRAELESGLHPDIETLAIVHKAIPIAQCALMRKDAVPQLPRWVGGAYDFYIATRLALTRRGAVYVNERLASFREHDANLGLKRSPVRDLVGARIYAGVVRGSHGAMSKYALGQAFRAVSQAPKSMVRSGQRWRTIRCGRLGR